ncbi:hypothetical protein H0G86_009627 [Trichoderma simmonsii]|uniref:Uncharacterized protein n=1 Tax=Trichoderma simmonsii TaxID=1491479 RepID=A0A8G0PN68_9HYPO|nr:hypothetical protein H0G86_009627 [Trichoderma simmonsii]
MSHSPSRSSDGDSPEWFPGTPEQEKQFRKWIEETDEPLWFENVARWMGKHLSSRLFDPSSYKMVAQDVLDYMAEEFQKKISPTATIKLPGYGYPLDRMPLNHFRVLEVHGISDWDADPLYVRELCMLKAIEEITSKSTWCVNVRDPRITDNWKKEILGLNWNDYVKYADFTPSMVDWCIQELKLKADLYETTGLIPVLDCAACVIKSDKLVPNTLKQELSVGSQELLQSISDGHIPYGIAFHLINPSTCPLIYNRSRILPNRRIDLTNCLEACGKGDILSSLWDPENGKGCHVFDNSFQWLPCDVVVDDTGTAKINSYINNLHPIEHADMYTTIEKFITLALPAWDIVYRWHEEFSIQRIETKQISYDCRTPDICADIECCWAIVPLSEVENYFEGKKLYEDKAVPKKEQESVTTDTEPASSTLPKCDEAHLLNLKLERNEDTLEEFLPRRISEAKEEHLAVLRRRVAPILDWFHETHPLLFPDLRKTTPAVKHVRIKPSDVRSSAFFSQRENLLQVIVQLTEIHLTPENPEYRGDFWDLDGMLNEHIVSTALFCYDSDNITDSHIYFEAVVPTWGLETVPDPNSYDTSRAFNVPPGGDLQVIGRVLSDPTWAVFYPNIYRHRQGSFSLADPTRPGYRKVLKLCLVDPAIPIISTSIVPPQQADWWTECKVHNEGVQITQRLPPELQNIVYNYVDMPIDACGAIEIERQLSDCRLTHELRRYGSDDSDSDSDGEGSDSDDEDEGADGDDESVDDEDEGSDSEEPDDN